MTNFQHLHKCIATNHQNNKQLNIKVIQLVVCHTDIVY